MKGLLYKRVLAITIDYGIWFLFTWQYISFFGVPNEEGNLSVSGLPSLVPVAFWFFLFPLMISNFGGSLGKLIIGLRVVTINGNRPSFAQAFKRHCLDMFEILVSFGVVAIVAAMNTEQYQRVGDLWAKTVVVARKSQSA